ncbi:MAG: SDR family oxidoreductase [Verrucomicrobiaceae bacterium]|nr:SDR family oxidoreductase [Verrucomicrobiaceae bacterium]
MSRSILITGANGGLGIGISQTFLQESPENHLWLGVRSNRDAAADLQSLHPDRVHLIELDVTSAISWDLAVETILATNKSMDVLINNAGHHDDQLLAMMTDDSWHKVIDSNLTGTFNGCRAVARTMMGQRRGRIINIASLSALLSPPGQANYAAAKAGVVGLTQSFAKEVARAGVTVNCLCPGYIDTPALSAMNPEQRQAATAKVPMRRLGRPEDVAAAAVFLASENAGYITGSVLKIDGGIF